MAANLLNLDMSLKMNLKIDLHPLEKQRKQKRSKEEKNKKYIIYTPFTEAQNKVCAITVRHGTIVRTS